MLEIWRDVKGYEGLYQVSNLGRVKSLERVVKNKNGYRVVRERIIKTSNNNSGYETVSLVRKGKYKTYLVHRLVAMTFPDLVYWTEDAKGKPFDELQVNHKNEFEKTNNCVDNLEWCTANYNNNYGTHTERQRNKIKGRFNNPKTSKPVLQYTLDGVFVAEYPSIMEAERLTKVNRSQIRNCCNNKSHCKSAGGYIWKYKSPYVQCTLLQGI